MGPYSSLRITADLEPPLSLYIRWGSLDNGYFDKLDNGLLNKYQKILKNKKFIDMFFYL
jgi:hypothetical protein